MPSAAAGAKAQMMSLPDEAGTALRMGRSTPQAVPRPAPLDMRNKSGAKGVVRGPGPSGSEEYRPSPGRGTYNEGDRMSALHNDRDRVTFGGNDDRPTFDGRSTGVGSGKAGRAPNIPQGSADGDRMSMGDRATFKVQEKSAPAAMGRAETDRAHDRPTFGVKEKPFTALPEEEPVVARKPRQVQPLEATPDKVVAGSATEAVRAKERQRTAAAAAAAPGDATGPTSSTGRGGAAGSGAAASGAATALPAVAGAASAPPSSLPAAAPAGAKAAAAAPSPRKPPPQPQKKSSAPPRA